jgi:hypothetical protein
MMEFFPEIAHARKGSEIQTASRREQNMLLRSAGGIGRSLGAPGSPATDLRDSGRGSIGRALVPLECSIVFAMAFRTAARADVETRSPRAGITHAGKGERRSASYGNRAAPRATSRRLKERTR